MTSKPLANIKEINTVLEDISEKFEVHRIYLTASEFLNPGAMKSKRKDLQIGSVPMKSWISIEADSFQDHNFKFA